MPAARTETRTSTRHIHTRHRREDNATTTPSISCISASVTSARKIIHRIRSASRNAHMQLPHEPSGRRPKGWLRFRRPPPSMTTWPPVAFWRECAHPSNYHPACGHEDARARRVSGARRGRRGSRARGRGGERTGGPLDPIVWLREPRQRRRMTPSARRSWAPACSCGGRGKEDSQARV